MKKLFFTVVSMLLVLLTTSCTNGDENPITSENDIPDVEVVDLANYRPLCSTRAIGDTLPGGPVLKFKDQQTFYATYDRFQTMSDEEKMAAFKELGFDGAYVLYATADRELDSIFDLKDRSVFLSSYDDFKKKHKSDVLYNDSDKYDLSVYPLFVDPKTALLGNKEGYVIIDDKVVSPSDQVSTHYTGMSNPWAFVKPDQQSSGTTTSPVQPDFYGIPGNLSVVVKNGKYRSDASFGYDRNSYLMMIRCASQKKAWFWKKRYNTDYTMDIYINGQKIHWYVKNVGRGVVIQFLAPFFDLRQYYGNGKNPWLNLSFKNFTSGCAGGQHADRDFKVDMSTIPFKY